MNNTQPTNTAHPEARLPDVGLDEIIKDLGRLGPASSVSREAFVTVASVAFLGAAVALMEPEPTLTGIVTVAAVAYLAARWVLGIRTWGQR